jgi:hypothetical protein
MRDVGGDEQLDTFVVINANHDGFAIALFGRGIINGQWVCELLDIVEDDKVSANKIIEQLKKYFSPDGRLRKDALPNIIKLRNLRANLRAILINEIGAISKQIDSLGLSIASERLDLTPSQLTDFVVAKNDKTMLFFGDLEADVSAKLDEVISDTDLPNHHYVSALIMAAVYNAEPPFAGMDGNA